MCFVLSKSLLLLLSSLQFKVLWVLLFAFLLLFAVSNWMAPMVAKKYKGAL